MQKIFKEELRWQAALCPLGAKPYGAGRDVEAKGAKASIGPSPHVMPGSATWNTYCATRQGRVGLEKIDETWGSSTFFPGHVLGLIAGLPIFRGHVTQQF